MVRESAARRGQGHTKKRRLQPELAVRDRIGIFLAALVAGLYMRYSFGELLRKYWETIKLVKFSLLTIAAMLALGFTTRYSGTDATHGPGIRPHRRALSVLRNACLAGWAWL